MENMDANAIAAVDGTTFAPALFIWIDFLGDPLRVSTFGKDYTFAGTGDADLDGNKFLAFDPRLITVGDVTNSENGSDTLTVTLSGIQTVNAQLMADIADKSKWQGRTVRLWLWLYDQTGTVPQGAVFSFYTGYASKVTVLPSAEGTKVQLEVENYLAAFSEASNRDYLNQSTYDAADNSAAATLAAANMGRGAPQGKAGTVGGGGSGTGGVSLSIGSELK